LDMRPRRKTCKLRLHPNSRPYADPRHCGHKPGCAEGVRVSDSGRGHEPQGGGIPAGGACAACLAIYFTPAATFTFSLHLRTGYGKLLTRLTVSEKTREMAIIRASCDWRDTAATAGVCHLGAKTWGRTGPSLRLPLPGRHLVNSVAGATSLESRRSITPIPLPINARPRRADSLFTKGAPGPASRV